MIAADCRDNVAEESVTSQPDSLPTVEYVTTAPEAVFDTPVIDPISSVDESVAGIATPEPIVPPATPQALDGNTTVPLSEDGCAAEMCLDEEDSTMPVNFLRMSQKPYVAYRSKQSHTSLIPGSGQDFGLFEWHSDPYLARRETSGFTGAMNMTWLSGPQSSPLPPRVYELSTGFQTRQHWSPLLSYDLSARIGIFSDFEGSARDGVRFPSHAVGIFHLNHSTDLVFGADILDRDDISVLPVFGFSLRSDYCRRLRMDLVFPRPRIEFSLSESERIYLSGELGGDTWDVGDQIDLVTTYRDYRVMLGFENAGDEAETSSMEVGYVFGRQLEVRGQPGQASFDDAFVIRLVTRY